MLVDRKNLSLHVRWMAVFAVGSLAAAIWYLVESWHAPRWPGGSSRVGLSLGIIAAVIFVFEVLLWPRKRLRAWRIGKAQTWLRAHIWLGLLCLPLVALHTGGQLGGQWSTSLTFVFVIVIASGLWGLAMQQFLPRFLLERVPAETIYVEIEHLAAQNCRDAEDLVLATCGGHRPAESQDEQGPDDDLERGHLTIEGYRTVGRTRGKTLQTRVVATAVPNSDPLRVAFYTLIGPYLKAGRRSKSVLADSLKAAQIFDELRDRLDPAAHPAVTELEGLCHQRRQFDLQARVHHWLHAWLLIHAPLSVMLMVLLAVHIYFACKYW